MANVINWFEIPAKDFDRACSFYEKVLDGTVQKIPASEGFINSNILPPVTF